MAPEPDELTFFVDRSLGKSIVAGLRAAGLRVLSMADVCGEKAAQLFADEVGCATPARTIGSS